MKKQKNIYNHNRNTILQTEFTIVCYAVVCFRCLMATQLYTWYTFNKSKNKKKKVVTTTTTTIQ